MRTPPDGVVTSGSGTTPAEWTAIGIAAVAAATGLGSLFSARRSASTAREAAEEARHARQDALGPDVSLFQVGALDGRWNVGPGSKLPPGLAEPGRTYTSPGKDEVRLLLGAVLNLRNEGTRTATVTVEAFRVEPADTDADLAERLSPPANKPDTRFPDGAFNLAPGLTIRVLVRTGPTLAEWIEHGDQPVKINVTAAVSKEGARQSWTVTLTTRLLAPQPHSRSEYRLLAHVMPDVARHDEPRCYPPGPGRRRRRGGPGR